MKIKKIDTDGYEEVLRCEDKASGLKAIIAVHSTRLGPALGGIRMHPYADEKEALEDVTRLARAMTYKAAASRIKLGGGKAVIMGDPHSEKSSEKLKAMGRFINQLEGRYLCAKDAGIVTEDLTEVSKETRYVTGMPKSSGGSGDPSPWTAIGVVEGIRAAIAVRLNRHTLEGLKVAIQGMGHVGYGVAEILREHKAVLTVADVRSPLTEKAKSKLGATIVAPEEIHRAPVDVFSPCAFGGVLDDVTINQLRSKVIAGGANNQLKDEKIHGELLYKKGILYAPDYVINAGGLINIYAQEILKEDSMPYIQKIGTHLSYIFEESIQAHAPTGKIANKQTEETLDQGL